VELSQLNDSPAGDTSLTAETKAKLMAQWAFAFDLHASLKRDGSVDPRFRVASGDSEAEDDDVVV
jgi:hypothetical protein